MGWRDRLRGYYESQDENLAALGSEDGPSAQLPQEAEISGYEPSSLVSVALLVPEIEELIRNSATGSDALLELYRRATAKGDAAGVPDVGVGWVETDDRKIARKDDELLELLTLGKDGVMTRWWVRRGA